MNKTVLLLTSSNPRTRVKSAFKTTSKLADNLTKQGNFSVEYERLQQVVFIITNKQVEGVLPSGKNIDNYDAVYVKRWLEEPWFGSALRSYFEIVEASTKVINKELVDFPNVNKFIEAIRFRQHNLPVCDTVFSVNINHVATHAARMFDFPFILKSAEGSRGQDNYLITDMSQLKSAVERHQDELFVAQRFIPNDCDYRIVVVNNKPKLAIKRSRSDSQTHLNNVSTGAQAELIDLSSIDDKVLNMAVVAAECFRLSVCGVDLLQNSETSEWVVLEVNATPDLTGSFADEKLNVFADFLESSIK